jgi:hypothetical protein
MNNSVLEFFPKTAIFVSLSHQKLGTESPKLSDWNFFLREKASGKRILQCWPPDFSLSKGVCRLARRAIQNAVR